jgi:hypothetical protein
MSVDDFLEPRHVRIRSYQIPLSKTQDEPESSFLNSFIASDLARVASEAERGTPALR